MSVKLSRNVKVVTQQLNACGPHCYQKYVDHGQRWQLCATCSFVCSCQLLDYQLSVITLHRMAPTMNLAQSCTMLASLYTCEGPLHRKTAAFFCVSSVLRSAEMRKGVAYIVDIKLCDSGSVLQAQCECALVWGRLLTASMFRPFCVVLVTLQTMIG